MRVQLVGTGNAENFASIDEFRDAATRLGITEVGVVDDPRLNIGLQGLPRFKELAGPMSPHKDGTEVRYETWEAYEIYSR